MNDTPKIKSPQLDRLIAESKQVTADLMAVRHEAQRLISARARETQFRPVRDRVSLVIDRLTLMSNELFELWQESSPYKNKPEPEPVNRDAPLLTNGQLTLIGGR